MVADIKPDIHGHRGARGLLPENSLVAIQAGIEHGCHAIEVDICVTKDNHLVIHHDPILSSYIVRNSDSNWVEDKIRIRDLNLATLKAYDIGRIKPETQYAEKFNSQISVDGTKIPSLKEIVELVDTLNSPVIYNLELKSTPYDPDTTPNVEQYIELVVSELEKFNIIDRVFLQSFDWRLVRTAKAILPKLKVGFLTNLQPDGTPKTPILGKPSLWTDNNDLEKFNNDIPSMIRFLGGDVWSSNQLDLNLQDVQYAQNLGLDVYVWTVNAIKDMERMIEIGVDAITTDYPDRLYALLKPK